VALPRYSIGVLSSMTWSVCSVRRGKVSFVSEQTAPKMINYHYGFHDYMIVTITKMSREAAEAI
jgi:hypothetical protein